MKNRILALLAVFSFLGSSILASDQSRKSCTQSVEFPVELLREIPYEDKPQMIDLWDPYDTAKDRASYREYAAYKKGLRFASNDAYDVMNPRETMNPWQTTKGEVRKREKRMKNYYNYLYNRKYKGLNREQIKLAQQQDLPKLKGLEDEFSNAFDDYYNGRQFNYPTFPRVERAKESLRSWFPSWYK